MSIQLIVVFMFVSMLALLVTGRQIFAIIGSIGVIAALALWGHGSERLPFVGVYSFMKWYPLLALPPFIFMGLTLSKSGVADNLFHSVYLWMGGIRGGLGMGTVVLCSIIAAMSGTSVAATVTAGTIALPSMLKRNYDKRLVTGIVQAGGALGFLIPPSLIFIIYGMIARVSVGHLWVAGIFPGLLLATMYIIYIAIRCGLQPHMGPALPPESRATWGEKFRSLKSGIVPVILIMAVLGLLFMGITTLIECAAIGAVGAISCAAINRRLSWRLINEVMDETLKLTSMLLWIFAAAITFGAIFDGLGAVHAVESMLNMVGGRWSIMIIMQFSFFLMGMVLDDTAMLLIVAPLYIPITQHLGFDLVWYGVLYVVNCQMAFLTPPFGYNLFIMKGLAPPEITIQDIYRSVIPFVGIQALCLAVVMAFPQIALWLPSIVFGKP